VNPIYEHRSLGMNLQSLPITGNKYEPHQVLGIDHPSTPGLALTLASDSQNASSEKL